MEDYRGDSTYSYFYWKKKNILKVDLEAGGEHE